MVAALLASPAAAHGWNADGRIHEPGIVGVHYPAPPDCNTLVILSDGPHGGRVSRAELERSNVRPGGHMRSFAGPSLCDLEWAEYMVTLRWAQGETDLDDWLAGRGK